jgi:hypothetical protein
MVALGGESDQLETDVRYVDTKRSLIGLVSHAQCVALCPQQMMSVEHRLLSA